jgi:putative endonuclease
MNKQELGRLGEDEAVRFLRERGWRILDRNVRIGRREVDVIAMKDEVLAFIEVKCRTTGKFGHPLEAITPRKRAGVAEVARAWLRRSPLPSGVLVRFDAISVSLSEGVRPEVLHISDAWRTG